MYAVTLCSGHHYTLLATLGVVGVERCMSETVRQTSTGEKLAPGAFATLERRGPQG